MCLVLDTCCVSCVLDATNKFHADFEPILKWVTEGKGKLIYGGSKYKTELAALSGYTRFFKQLETARRMIEMPEDQVDRLASQVKKQVQDAKFNDEHLIALIAISRCCVVCTNDKLADKFLKRSDLYPSGVKKPKIYRAKKHFKLCCDRHIAPICRA